MNQEEKTLGECCSFEHKWKIARGHISKSIRRTRLKFSPRVSTTTITLCAKFNRNLRCRVLFRDFFGRSVVECPNSENAFLRAICESEICYRSRIRRSWFTRLYTAFNSGITWVTWNKIKVLLDLCAVCVLYMLWVNVCLKNWKWKWSTRCPEYKYYLSIYLSIYLPTHIHDPSRISIDCLTPASRLRRSASVW